MVALGEAATRAAPTSRPNDTGGVSVSFTNYLLALSAILFVIGAAGVLLRRNALVIFMCIEMMLNAVNLSFVALANHFMHLTGQVFVLLVMVVASAEVAVGLAIVMTIVSHKDTTNIEDVNLLKG